MILETDCDEFNIFFRVLSAFDCSLERAILTKILQRFEKKWKEDLDTPVEHRGAPKRHITLNF